MSDTFAEFVNTRSPQLLRTAYLLTHDWAAAEDLLQTSLTRAWGAWNRIDGDPEPYVRRIMVNTFSSWWRRKWRAEQPHGELPELASEDPYRKVDARDEVLRALDRLPRRQRAVLVLRYFEDLPEAEIADVLGVKPGTVKSQAAKALAKLRSDPGLFPETPGLDHLRLPQVRQRISKRRTQRIVAAAGAVLLFISGYALSTAASGKRPPDPGTPSPSPSVSVRPEFDNGRRTVATGLSAPGGALSVTLTWTPVKDSHTITVSCRAGDLGVTGGRAVTRVNGKPYDGLGCGMITVTSVTAMGGQIGQPVTMSVSIDASPTGPYERTPTHLEVLVDVEVPFAEYPFPSRPAALKTLVPFAACEGTSLVVATSNPADPTKPVTAAVSGAKRVLAIYEMTTPGVLEARSGDQILSTHHEWDYKAGLVHSVIDNVTAPITFVPKQVDGPWQVALITSPDGSYCLLDENGTPGGFHRNG